MRFQIFFSLAFISGVYGFNMFAPYLLIVIAVGQMLRSRRKAAGLPVHASEKPLQFAVADRLAVHGAIA